VRFADLARRLGTAAVVIPVLLLAIFKGPPAAVVGIIAVGAVLALWEFYGLLAARGVAALRVAGFLALAALFVPGFAPHWWSYAAVPAVVAAVILASLVRGRDIPGSVPALTGTLFGACYVGVLGGAIAGLRTLPADPVGRWAIFLLFSSLMFGDSMAYFVGSALGRHKLAPAISPGKSWEGLAGGVVGGILATLFARRFGLPAMSLAHAIGVGVAVTLAGTAGDLAESLMKRWAGVKDSGTLFPGHGGMLDRVDSLLLGAPVLYYYFLYLYPR
jgi:phosphatidate cytidylyltransferase